MKNKYPIIFLSIIILIFFLIITIQSPKRKLPKINKIQNNMLITSPVFSQNQPIPSQYTCDGENINPPLEIKDIPKEAKSLVLIVDDPDAPGGTFLHWLVFNIEPNIKRIEENSIPEKGIEGLNSFGKTNYGGPCPPSGTHRYFFKLYALDTKLNLPQGTDLKTVKETMQNHILSQAELIGLYKRK